MSDPLPTARIGGLTPVTVTVEGEWSPSPVRDWRGLAEAAEPVVSVVFLSTDAGCWWCKSERRATGEVRLAFIPYDSAGPDVQLVFSVRNGVQRLRCTLPTSRHLPVVPSRRQFAAGTVERFGGVDGIPTLKLAVLFIARRDVRGARNGLWHLRREFAEGITHQPLRRVLTYGRRGHFT